MNLLLYIRDLDRLRSVVPIKLNVLKGKRVLYQGDTTEPKRCGRNGKSKGTHLIQYQILDWIATSLFLKFATFFCLLAQPQLQPGGL